VLRFRQSPNFWRILPSGLAEAEAWFWGVRFFEGSSTCNTSKPLIYSFHFGDNRLL
jgi:hypothetical protein